jgi:hypothetical protein
MASRPALREAVRSRLRELDARASARGDEDTRLEDERDKAALEWKADAPGKKDEEETVYVYVSSAARDASAWPSPSQYRIALTAEVDNVVEAAVVQGSFPVTCPAIDSSRNTLAFSFSPFSAPSVVTVAPGSYTGTALALELMIQMNQSVYAASIPGTYTMNFATGFLQNGSGVLPPGVNQFRVAYDDSRSQFRFQLVDAAQQPASSPNFALHALKSGADLFAALGLPLAALAAQAASDGVYWRVTNQGLAPAFSKAADVDQRYAHSVFSSAAADLSGPCAFVLDVPQLNDNDVAVARSASSKFNIGSCLGLVYIKEPAYMNDNLHEFNNSSYPIKKTYREGVARLGALNVNIRRLDGSLVEFRGVDHCFTLRLTVKRTQPLRPVFAR